MSYVVLARKWRPQQFADVLGQEHITQTLTNAIGSGRIAHAFLFSGPRGVGKTSAARILAKALSCERDGQPTATPCGVCRQCVEITEGRSTDVFEIDAASHTGVDNVREIIDNCRYLPSSARFKVYVIDEVHMLSTGAFNALLKTLEEPPAHVKFVLATTDAHKVPVTILSRCQRYDFRRIALARMGERLSQILQAEGIEHDPTALALLARESEGSMRDAQSLLEQVLAYAAGRRLDAPLIRESLGVVDGALVERAFACLFEHAPGKVIDLVGEVYHRGFDLSRFAEALVEYARDLLVAKFVAEPRTAIDRPSDEVEKMITRAKRVDAPTLERWFEGLAKAVEEVGRSAQPRYVLEVGLATLAEGPVHVPFEALLTELSRIEALLSGGPRPGPAPRGGGGGSSGEPPRRGGPMAPPPSARAEVREGPGVALGSAPPPPAPGPAPAPGPIASDRGGNFVGFVQLVKKRRPPLAANLALVRPLQFGPGRVELGCETAFDEQKLNDPETKRALEGLLSEYLGAPTQLTVQRTKGAAVEAPPTLQEAADEAQRAKNQEKAEVARERPAVKAVAGEFGGSIAKVRVVDEG